VDAAGASQRRVRAVVLYSQDDVPSDLIASAVAAVETQFPELSVWWDGLLPFGFRWNTIWGEKLESCDLAIVFWGPSWDGNSWSVGLASCGIRENPRHAGGDCRYSDRLQWGDSSQPASISAGAGRN
jgi:hypothetical protein